MTRAKRIGAACLLALLWGCRVERTETREVRVPSDSDSTPTRVAIRTERRIEPPEQALDTRPWIPDSASVRISPDAAPVDTSWTAGVVERRRADLRPVALRSVRTARNPGFDRAVWEFEGVELPGYHLEYVDAPVRRCGSGEVTEIRGQGWLRVRLTPARAHTEAGEATVRERERRLDLPVLRELESTCDFEGNVEWVLGVAHPNRYRVMELHDPARLVVDVRH